MQNAPSSKARVVRVKSLPTSSIAYQAGLRAGDTIISINDVPIHDDLGFRVHSACEFAQLTIDRRGSRRNIEWIREPGTSLDVEFYPQPLGRCRNRCVFCFINQLPPGLRKSLYVKDEDIDHSFANGNYVTLASANRDDLQRIVEHGISPLYVSVHATDRVVRQQLLRNNKAADIMEQLSFLERNGILFHTQIVVCPGINDGPVLRSTLEDLLRFREGLLSVALVPVGLTRFHRNGLQPVGSALARETCTIAEKLASKDQARGHYRRVFIADELYIKAQLPLPPSSYYGDYPQIENGVGLVRSFLSDWSKAKRALREKLVKYDTPRRIAVVTGVSAAPYIGKSLSSIRRLFPRSTIQTIAVENDFFGRTVTVAGLLTARDILARLKKIRSAVDLAILPGVIFNTHGVTLDGYSLERMITAAGIPILRAGTASQLLSSLIQEHQL